MLILKKDTYKKYNPCYYSQKWVFLRVEFLNPSRNIACMDYKTTLYNIFAPRKSEFAVPGYQRAYAWEADKQVAQFLTDIKEHPEGLERYHFGHFLFETTPSQRDKFWIIDGQQRLTTAVLFLGVIYRKLAAYPEHEIAAQNLRQEFFVSADGRYKFRTVDYDNNFFINLVIEDRPDQPIRLPEEGYKTPTSISKTRYSPKLSKQS